MTSTSRHLICYDLEQVEYEDALVLQRAFALARTEKLQKDVLLVLEHPPTVTMGKRAKDDHLLVGRQSLENSGVGVFSCDRGGEVTCHMPGQLVAYPIFKLAPDRCDVHRYVSDLEQVMIDTLGDFSLEGHRVEGRRGVFLGEGESLRKIGAVGIHLSRWISTHGICQNVNNRLDLFRKIVPCGLTDVPVTSFARELWRPPNCKIVYQSLIRNFARRFDAGLDRGKFSLRTISLSILRRRNDDFEILLLKRHPHRGDYWQPVTGSIERGESPTACAIREMREESGLSGRVWNLGFVHSFLFGEPRPTRMPRVFQETSFWTLVDGNAPVILDSREHCEHAWVHWRKALEMVPVAALRRAIEKAVKAANASFSRNGKFFEG